MYPDQIHNLCFMIMRECSLESAPSLVECIGLAVCISILAHVFSSKNRVFAQFPSRRFIAKSYSCVAIMSQGTKRVKEQDAANWDCSEYTRLASLDPLLCWPVRSPQKFHVLLEANSNSASARILYYQWPNHTELFIQVHMNTSGIPSHFFLFNPNKMGLQQDDLIYKKEQ